VPELQVHSEADCNAEDPIELQSRQLWDLLLNFEWMSSLPVKGTKCLWSVWAGKKSSFAFSNYKTL